ncbi:MAG: hypothetical protein JXR96_29800 [Deltaproteobacteria bacterium]|nr:hypothetical protein [Deltaproteobacteria bacterium]
MFEQSELVDLTLLGLGALANLAALTGFALCLLKRSPRTIAPEIFETAVLGELRPARQRGLAFRIATGDEDGLAFDRTESLEQLAQRLDLAAGGSAPRLRLE